MEEEGDKRKGGDRGGVAQFVHSRIFFIVCQNPKQCYRGGVEVEEEEVGYSCIADAVEDEMRQSSRGVVVALPLQVRTRGAKEERGNNCTAAAGEDGRDRREGEGKGNVRRRWSTSPSTAPTL